MMYVVLFIFVICIQAVIKIASTKINLNAYFLLRKDCHDSAKTFE